jgi:hypothetical protein
MAVPDIRPERNRSHHQPSFEEAHVMESFDGTTTSGRKGIAYDWQSLLVASEAATIEFELAMLTPEYAQ